MAPPLKLVKRPRPEHLNLSHPKKRKSVVLVETAHGFEPEQSPVKPEIPTPALSHDLNALRLRGQKLEQPAITYPRKTQTRVGRLLSEGIRLGFLKADGTQPVPRVVAQGQPSDQRYSPKREMTTIKMLQNSFDAAYHLEDPQYPTFTEKVKREKYSCWKPTPRFVALTSRRLHGITEMQNATPFVPSELQANLITPRGGTHTLRHQAGLWRYLQGACRLNGYRRLRLDTVTFTDTSRPMQLDASFNDQRTKPSTNGEQGPTSSKLLTIDASEATLELYEIPITDEFGALRKWLVLKITRPAEQGLPMGDAMIVFACPVTQVMKAKENEEPIALLKPTTRSTRARSRAQTIARLVDRNQFNVTVYNPMAGKRLCLEFLMSKHGIPSFECSESAIAGSDQAQTRSITATAAMCCHDDSAGPSSTRVAPKLGQNKWQDIKTAMARFGCMMEVKAKPETTWAEVGAATFALRPLQSAPAVSNVFAAADEPKPHHNSISREALPFRSRKSRRNMDSGMPG